MIDQTILETFRNESRELLDQLNQIVTQLEREKSRFPTELIEEFAQKIDRMMGAAKTMAIADPGHATFEAIGRLGELCKMVGNKASLKADVALVPIFAAFWADTIEHMSELLDHLGDRAKSEQISKQFSQVLQGRLKWLAGHLK